jgi:hypothetical protein
MSSSNRPEDATAPAAGALPALAPAAVHRRVVTGHDETGRSIIVMDGVAANSRRLMAAGGLQLTELWETARTPASNEGNDDPSTQPRGIEPLPGGSVFRVIEYPPDSVRLATISPDDYYRDMGATRDSSGKRRHAGMHRTDTIDYVIVLRGEIWAVMDEGETLLRAGDVLIQRGTNHAWSNRTDESCLVAFVLISADPLKGAE